MAERLIPPSLQRNEAFKTDVKNFLSLGLDSYKALRDESGNPLETSVNEEDVAKLVSVMKVGRDEATHLLYTYRFAVSALADDDRKPEDLLAEMQELVGANLDSDRQRAISEAITPTGNDRHFATSSAAFSFGDAYLYARVDPILSPGRDSDASLYAGAAVSIVYRHMPEEETRSLTFFASADELRVLARTLSVAADKSDQLLKSPSGAAK
jgi:hypothetical protein